MMKRLLTVALGVLVAGPAPALAGGGGSYKAANNSSPFYVGGVIGYGWGKHRGDGVKISTRGVMGGGVVGYGVSYGAGTIAVEGDILASDINRNEVETDSYGNGPPDRYDYEVGTDILASLRVKGSWGKGNLRPYLTGGIAWQRLGLEFDNDYNVGGEIKRESGSEHEDQFGITLGAGLDWQKEGSYSVSLGYHYYRFKDDAFESDGDVTTDLHTIRLGGKLHY